MKKMARDKRGEKRNLSRKVEGAVEWSPDQPEGVPVGTAYPCEVEMEGEMEGAVEWPPVLPEGAPAGAAYPCEVEGETY